MSIDNQSSKSKGTKRRIMPIDETEFGRLQGKVDRIEQVMEKLDHKLFGNGQPGIMEIINRHDERLAESQRDRKALRESLDNVIKGIQEMNSISQALSKQITEFKLSAEAEILAIKSSVKSNIRTWAIEHWKGIVFFVVAIFVFLHSILPPDLTIWKLIEKLF